MKNGFQISVTLPASPEEIYEGWLTSRIHTAFTGSKATASKKVGSKFTAWDGYISGTNLQLEPNKKIVQLWRTTEFRDEAPDSCVTITLEKVKSGTKLTLKHTNIPDEQDPAYKEGWKEFYFIPMRAYFLKKITR